MIVYQSNSNIYTHKDYAPSNLPLDNLRLDFEEKDFHLEKDDFVAYVPGSMSLLELDSILEKHGFLFNYTALADYNLSRLLGENSYDLSSLVLGLDLYHSDQSLSKTGGKVIKNVSGYDLAKLYLGSYNSFAIITGAYLRLEKLPEKQVDFRLYQEIDSLQMINSTEVYKFLFDLCTADFDNNYQAQILIYKDESKIFKVFTELSLFASNHILELRKNKLRDKLEKFFNGTEILEHKTNFKKTYREDKESIQLSCKLDSLESVISFLIQEELCPSLKIYPKQSLIEINGRSEALLEAVSRRFPGQISVKIYPRSRENLLVEKKYQITNQYELKLIQDFKNSFDPEGILNPGVL